MHQHGDAPSFAAAATMWLAMMAAMMAPAAWPWIRSFHRFGSSAPSSTVRFAAGYLAAWVPYSLAGAALQLAVPTPATIAPLVFAAAGVYQLAPLKSACLRHCRNPIGYFLANWRSRPIASFRMGLEHGVYCVGCCWALMATMLVVGATQVWWMVALAAVAFVEQVVANGHRMRVPLGLALIGAAALRLT